MAADPSDRIDAKIDELDDWRGRLLSRLRTLIKQADRDVVEEWKCQAHLLQGGVAA